MHERAVAPSAAPKNTCASRQSLKDGVLGVGTSFRVGVVISFFLNAVLHDEGMFIHNGSGALMITYVAAGRLIGYFEPHMNAWDALAGFVLVKRPAESATPSWTTTV